MSDLQEVLRAYDNAMLTMFFCVAAYVINWYAWEQPAVRRVMTVVPLLSSIIVMIAKAIT